MSGNSPVGASLDSLRERWWQFADRASSGRARILAAGVVCTVALAGYFVLDNSSGDVKDASSSPEAVLPRAQTTTSAAPMIIVQATGAVRRPGVYELAADARVSDVVDHAGGLAEDADDERINLAAKIVDGQRIFVARKGQSDVPVVGSSTESGDGMSTPAPLDLNSASSQALEELPGIGPATAKAIVDYRARNGGFRTVDDLGKIKGIGPAKLTQLRELVRV